MCRLICGEYTRRRRPGSPSRRYDIIRFARRGWCVNGLIITSCSYGDWVFDPRHLSDVFDAVARAIEIIQSDKHDPHEAHARISGMYDWSQIAMRTERVYHDILARPETDLWTRMSRCVLID